MARVPASGSGKLFGLPRNVAIGAALVGVALVVFFWYKARSASGATAQANLPADTTSASDQTAAPQLGGTPDSGASAASLSGSDLLGAFTSSENALLGGFQSQEALIGSLTGGILGLAQTQTQTIGSLAGSGVNYGYPPSPPIPGSIESWPPQGPLFPPAPAPVSGSGGGYVDVFLPPPPAVTNVGGSRSVGSAVAV